MRIAVLLSRCSTLGPFIVARDIVNQIHDKVSKVDVYYLRESEEKLSFRANLIKLNFTTALPFHEYDIVHSHGFVADAYMFYHGAARKTIQVTTIHQRIAPDYAMKYNRLFGQAFEYIWCRCFTKATNIVTLTDYMLNYYKKRVRYHSIQYIHNGIEVAEHSGEIPKEEKELLREIRSKFKIMGTVSRLVYLKGIDQAIKALEADPGLALIIIGDGEKMNELKTLASTLAVDNRCFFLGYKKNPIRYLSYFDLFIMPSRSEGFGLSTIEAASQKLPIVCSDLPVYAEIFSEADVCRFELENISSLNQAIDTALSHKEKLAINAYTRYRENFTSGIMADNYLKLYNRLLNKRPPIHA
jgi:glycosyltransferase involved in cell wall biosynthesis